MKRREFLEQVTLYSSAAMINFSLFNEKDVIVGHNGFRYKVDTKWGKLDQSKFPVKDCHEMVIDGQGRIILLTNDVRNNIIIYNKDGKLLDTWGTQFPGGHGLSIHEEGGEEFLFITDTDTHQVVKTTLNGNILFTFPSPLESELYTSIDQFKPTETAIAQNGDVYISDGYGLQFIHHYNNKGELLNVFGGRGNEENKFNNAHGIAIDKRDGQEKLLITARAQNKLKLFDMKGEYLSSIDLPGAYICRPVIHNSEVYLATIWSQDGAMNTGFISILNKENKLISALGGNKPIYDNGRLQSMRQTVQIFQHPHDVCVDRDENLYVCQWNAGQVYPYKLIRI